jgi:hypothetical protein
MANINTRTKNLPNTYDMVKYFVPGFHFFTKFNDFFCYHFFIKVVVVYNPLLNKYFNLNLITFQQIMLVSQMKILILVC